MADLLIPCSPTVTSPARTFFIIAAMSPSEGPLFASGAFASLAIERPPAVAWKAATRFSSGTSSSEAVICVEVSSSAVARSEIPDGPPG